MTLNNLKDVFENPDQLPFFKPILFNTMGFYVGYVRVPADFLVKLDVATEHSLVNFSLKGVDYLDEVFNGYTDNEITFGNVANDGSVMALMSRLWTGFFGTGRYRTPKIFQNPDFSLKRRDFWVFL